MISPTLISAAEMFLNVPSFFNFLKFHGKKIKKLRTHIIYYLILYLLIIFKSHQKFLL